MARNGFILVGVVSLLTLTLVVYKAFISDVKSKPTTPPPSEDDEIVEMEALPDQEKPREKTKSQQKVAEQPVHVSVVEKVEIVPAVDRLPVEINNEERHSRSPSTKPFRSQAISPVSNLPHKPSSPIKEHAKVNEQQKSESSSGIMITFKIYISCRHDVRSKITLNFA